jgi:two-component system, NtrC family, response regulator AtoC
MPSRKILVADDEEHMRFFIRELLTKEDYEVIEAENGQEAVEKCTEEDIDLVILDYKMPVLDGLEALTRIREEDSRQLVLMVTAHDTKDLAVEAIRRGAYDYFTKPFDVNEIRIIIRRALEKKSLEEQVSRLAEELDQRIQDTRIIGESRSMWPVFDTIRKVADSDVTVLINGESGTGKELVAKAIHFGSSRNEKPFVALNCAAIPDTLLESELFGHEKGAFTGASDRKIGKFELAEGGTLFLDEIGDMNLATQSKILRVLQEKEFQRLGGAKTIASSARILSATNKNLLESVRAGTFREDLYYRLNVIPIQLPPLRDRKEDLPLLVRHFINIANERFTKDVESLSPEVEKIFNNYDWPGNIRQMENVIYRATILATGRMIRKEDLPPEILEPDQTLAGRQQPAVEAGDLQPAALESLPPGPLTSTTKQMTETMEKDIILKTLEECKWKRGVTADRLGISRRSLLRKMNKYGIK